MGLCEYVSVHLARADRAVGADHRAAGTGPAVRFLGVSVDWGGDVTRPRVGDRWAAVAFHVDEQSARQAVDQPPPVLGDGVDVFEEWHVAGEVVAHRGETNWLDGVGPMLSGSGAQPGEPVMVMTTAGFVFDENFDFDRANDFVTRVAATVEHFASLPSNSLALDVAAATVGLDGITLSVWNSVPSFVDAAYRTGLHAENLERHRGRPMFDRSSFTRIRPIASRGSWMGVDPLSAARLDA